MTIWTRPEELRLPLPAHRKPSPEEVAEVVAALMTWLNRLADSHLLAAWKEPERQSTLSRLSFLCRTACFDLRDLWREAQAQTTLPPGNPRRRG